VRGEGQVPSSSQPPPTLTRGGDGGSQREGRVGEGSAASLRSPGTLRGSWHRLADCCILYQSRHVRCLVSGRLKITHPGAAMDPAASSHSELRPI
jgi:hypothetical protein